MNNAIKKNISDFIRLQVSPRGRILTGEERLTLFREYKESLMVLEGTISFLREVISGLDKTKKELEATSADADWLVKNFDQRFADSLSADKESVAYFKDAYSLGKGWGKLKESLNKLKNFSDKMSAIEESKKFLNTLVDALQVGEMGPLQDAMDTLIAEGKEARGKSIRGLSLSDESLIEEIAGDLVVDYIDEENNGASTMELNELLMIILNELEQNGIDVDDQELLDYINERA